VPYRTRYLMAHFIAVVRWPVFLGLGAACLMQFAAAFVPDIKPDQVNVPDLIPPLNTAILALLWWRVSQLEKFRDRHEENSEDRRRLRRRE
jgi:hypothetical protein